ncbi:MBL fold metallo-hydrolase [Priestia sp. FSL W8-0001]|uniref:MBL fold metallo-hydrolase n=1 Tax=unclassified Priestia TaxID=2800374 RepID=UPI0030F654FF
MKEQIHKFTLPTPFAVGDVNVYVLKGESITLIDAGVKTEEAWNSFTKQLNEIGLHVEDIDQVLLTHHHPDHVGMLDYFSPDTPVIGHWRNEPWISKDPNFFDQYDRFFTEFFTQLGVDERFRKYLKGLRHSMKYSCERSLNNQVQEGSVIKGLEDWGIIEVPGHAQSHIALYHQQSETLIGGDVLLKHISSNPLIEPPYHEGEKRKKSMLQYNTSLRRLSELPISCIYTGHGDEVKEVSKLVSERLTKQRERAEKVYQLLKNKPMSAFDVCKFLFPSVYEKELGLTMSETVGQLDYLESLRQVSCQYESDRFIYHTH